jgi:hypothetical protein
MQNSVKLEHHLAHRKSRGEINTRPRWKSVLELSSNREITSGSEAELYQAIRRGADLRIYTEFRFNEHVDLDSPNSEIVREVSDFPVTYLINGNWSAGIMSQRVPIVPPEGFGPKASMSFFMYNQNGQQAIARPYLDGPPIAGKRGRSTLGNHLKMPKYHEQDSWDAETNAPSSNFIYDFECYRFLVSDDWQEALVHSENGTVESGSLDALCDAFTEGRDIKVGIRGLCTDLTADPEAAFDHTVFVQTGQGYYCSDRRLFCAGSHPVVRVCPGIPMQYTSGGWDFGWLMVRTDGIVKRWLCDPYTLRFHKSSGRYTLRWFVR